MLKLKQFPQETWEVVNLDYNNDKIDVIQSSLQQEEDLSPEEKEELASQYSINDVEAIVNSSEAKKQSLHQLHQLLIFLIISVDYRVYVGFVATQILLTNEEFS
ncbi:MAG: hypothetical protein AAFS12_12765 [Cyanobacteria bacterium J06632_19]